MTITVEAVYENGVLKLSQPLPFKENERVSITVRPAMSVARQSAGMVRWSGDPETLDRLIRDPEFGIMESP
jgi:predicted DNA-binding antitoxin AbrB/MazE fold protein